jgi:transposase
VKDARSLSQQAQEEKRKIAIELLKTKELTQEKVAASVGVNIRTVQKWLALYKQGGRASLNKRSRKPNRSPRKKLTVQQEKKVSELIQTKNPDQLKLECCLWTREAVIQIIKNRFKVRLSLTSVGRLLRSQGFTVQRPKKRAYEQKSEDVKKWIDKVYPEIERAAKSEKATIYWGDEMGLRSDDQRGRGYSLKGKTPVVEVPGRRFGCNVISILSNRGKLFYMVYRGRFNAKLFIEFLNRLLRTIDRKIFLIIDGHPVHKSKLVRDYVLENSKRLRLIILPPYSPELNPDEMLNQDVKSNAFRESRSKNQEEMIKQVSSYLRSCQKQPEKVQRYFQAESVKYAA